MRVAGMVLSVVLAAVLLAAAMLEAALPLRPTRAAEARGLRQAEVATRGRHRHHYRPPARPAAAPELLEPGVSPFEENVIVPLESAIKTVRVIPIVRWRLWCERVGGHEC